MSQSELAALVGVSASQISKIEVGETAPSFGVAVRIGRVLGPGVWRLSDESFVLPPPDELNKLPDEVKEFLRQEDGLAFVKVGPEAKKAGVSAKELVEYVKLRVRFRK